LDELVAIRKARERARDARPDVALEDRDRDGIASRARAR
jgi:hypothetical protein